MPTRSSVVRVGVGVFLLATAALKLHGLGASGVPRVGWFAQPWVQLLAIEWELVLGAWLLSGWWTRASWLAAVLTFGAFAAVSGYLGWVGVASCGCFGVIQANPWWAFGADVVALGLLAASRPAQASGASPSVPAVGAWLGSVVLSCAGLVAAGVLAFGSVDAAFAKLRGESVVVTPYVDFGSAGADDVLTATATVANYTDKPVRLVGGTTDCTCATMDDFPLDVPPGGRSEFRIRLKVPGDTQGQFTRVAVVRTDCAERPLVRFQLGCRVE